MNPIGIYGEELAHKYLVSRSYKILFRNYAKPRWGEIDVIALDGDEIVFVEVKTRTQRGFGGPLASITPHKLNSLNQSINYFLTHEGIIYIDYPKRIDVIAIIIDKNTKKIDSLEQFTVGI